MNSHSEKACLEDPASFRRQKGHHAIDVITHRSSKDNSTISTSEKLLDESDIVPWLNTPTTSHEPPTTSFKLLVCAPRDEYQEMILPMSPQTYSALAKAWSFPPLVLCALRQPYSMSTFFTPTSHPASTGLILRFDCHWERECALVVIHHPSQSQTTALLAGLTPAQVPALLSLVRGGSARLAAHPLFLPALVLSEMAQNQTDWLGLVAPDLDDIQRRLGMANWGYAADSPFYGPDAAENLVRIDLPGIITRLNRMADSVRFQDQVALTLIEVLEELGARLDGDGGAWGRTAAGEAGEEIAQTVTVLTKTLRGCQRRITYRSGTIQGLIDTVYTLIAQRDNYLSLDMAFHTRRDSTDMRMIAAVTLFFLPGMFTATLFSTSFFDFHADATKDMLSPYHWIYWSTTTAATVGVLGFWFFYTKRDQKNQLPDFKGLNEPGGGAGFVKRSYNTTDFPEDKRRVRRFAGW